MNGITLGVAGVTQPAGWRTNVRAAFEKLDAVARRHGRDDIEPDSFVRRWEDAAQRIDYR